MTAQVIPFPKKLGEAAVGRPRKRKLKRVEHPDVVVTQTGPNDEDLEDMVGALTIESDAAGAVLCVTFDPLPEELENWYTDEVGGVVQTAEQIRVRDNDEKCWWRFDILTDDEDS